MVKHVQVTLLELLLQFLRQFLPWIHTGFVGGLELLQGGALLQQEVGGFLDDVLLRLRLRLALAGTRNLTQAAEGVGEVSACRRANT